MYVSVTGLKPKGLMGWIRFLTLTMPASKDAQKAEGILHCAFNSRNGYQHTLTCTFFCMPLFQITKKRENFRCVSRICHDHHDVGAIFSTSLSGLVDRALSPTSRPSEVLFRGLLSSPSTVSTPRLRGTSIFGFSSTSSQLPTLVRTSCTLC